MKADYKLFSIKHQIFPRQRTFGQTQPFCGHLNRQSTPYQYVQYLKARKQGISMQRGMSIARRCFCRMDAQKRNNNQQKLIQIVNEFKSRKNLITQLQNTNITGYQYKL